MTKQASTVEGLETPGGNKINPQSSFAPLASSSMVSLKQSNTPINKIIKEKLEYNAIVLQKDDVENPIFRVDALYDKVTPKQLFEVLKNQEQISSWFGKQIQSKFKQVAQDGSEIFSTIYKGSYPLNNREVLHRRLIQCDDKNQIYMINFTTQGLEHLQTKTKKYARVFHNLCGIVIRGALFNEKNEVTGSKIFFTMQMEFTGHYIQMSDQTKTISNFMLDYVERLIDKAQKVKV
ncbi:UNKNOWN [Stylonychia lemnae]|uniref:START domain-containing protein n=1 Tax=Stylonychia lemnae TaxID=5949 RepID=A0A078AGU4_STYLE|nr:UNKNOWN [Stylonychia lemnae]|eukprot:CDW80078.1 UNKNOWN [Stylonychia lemnae]